MAPVRISLINLMLNPADSGSSAHFQAWEAKPVSLTGIAGLLHGTYRFDCLAPPLYRAIRGVSIPE
jgi:hypothetical protein